MELPNIGGAMGGLQGAGQPPVNPTAPTTRRPAFPEGQDPAKAAPVPPATSPHAAPAEKIVVHSQQGLREALREMKLAETPQNLLIAETLRQFEQAVSARNVQLVATALRGMADQGHDDVAAAVILLLNDLPVTKANVAALRQLMTGLPMPAQLAKLEGQVQGLLSQLGRLDAQLGGLAQAGPPPPTGPTPQPAAPGQVPMPAPGTGPAPVPPAIVAAATQAAAAQSQAQAVTGKSPSQPTSATSTTAATEGGDEAGEAGPAAPGANKATAGIAHTPRQGEQGPLKRALGGAIGSTGNHATAGGQAAAAVGMDAEPAPATVTRPGGRPAPDGQPDARQGRSPQPPTAQSGPAPAGTPADRPQPPTADSATRGPSLHVRPPDGRPSSSVGGPVPGSNQAGPAATVPPASAGGTAPSQGLPSPAPTGQPVPQASAPPIANPGAAAPGSAAPMAGQPAGSGLASGHLADNAGMTPGTAQPMGDSGPEALPGLPRLAPRLEAALTVLRGLNGATTMAEPAQLAQQVEALTDLYGPLHELLKQVGGDLHRYLQATPNLDGLDGILALLAKLTGRRLIAAGIADEQRQALLRLFQEVHESIHLTGTTVKEALQQLQAREQLSQANQVFCLPLALPGPPQRPVELLIEPDQDSRWRDGQGRTRIRLAVDTHHLGAVGIDLTSWQQELNIQLQVTEPSVQAKLAAAQPILTKALARLGYTSADVSVALVKTVPTNSMLLPERRHGHPRSLNRIEGVV